MKWLRSVLVIAVLFGCASAEQQKVEYSIDVVKRADVMKSKQNFGELVSRAFTDPNWSGTALDKLEIKESQNAVILTAVVTEKLSKIAIETTKKKLIELKKVDSFLEFIRAEIGDNKYFTQLDILEKSNVSNPNDKIISEFLASKIYNPGAKVEVKFIVDHGKSVIRQYPYEDFFSKYLHARYASSIFLNSLKSFDE